MNEVRLARRLARAAIALQGAGCDTVLCITDFSEDDERLVASVGRGRSEVSDIPLEPLVVSRSRIAAHDNESEGVTT